MDFFEKQEVARRKTGALVGYFVFAVIGIILALYLVLFFGRTFAGITPAKRGPSAPAGWEKLIDPALLLGTSVGTLAVILLGSGFKTLQLSGGGSVVARDLGGRRIDPDTRDHHERRLLNVVEEMAIAAGVPVPEVFLMEHEDAINAFAAGRNPGDAVIGVSRGCMKLLSRDELQGVIAHEFSHILNGDMRLNLRLIGLLHGILLLTIIGRIVVRGSYYSSSSSRERGSGGIVLFGVALIIIGAIGVFFGKLIKAAVSRQREFLADASAVQFTRNPDGIAGALKKIGGLTQGSRLQNPRAEEASHMFFANGMAAGFAASFATHPPLDIRIKAIDPSWDGRFPQVTLPAISEGWREEAPPSPPPLPRRDGMVQGLTPAAAFQSIGEIRRENIEVGRAIRDEIPDDWLRIVRHPSGAQAAVFGLLLSADEGHRSEQVDLLEDLTDGETARAALKIREEVGELHSSRKIAVVDLSMPALRRMSPGEYDRFSGVMKRLMESDRQIDLFEFSLRQIVRRHLDGQFHPGRTRRAEYRSIDRLGDECSVLLTTLAFLGHDDDREAAERAFAAGVGELEAGSDGGRLGIKPPEECSLDLIEQALQKIDRATPLVKRQVLYACGRVVMADNEVRSEELELLRAVADAIGVPIPPFVETGS